MADKPLQLPQCQTTTPGSPNPGPTEDGTGKLRSDILNRFEMISIGKPKISNQPKPPVATIKPSYTSQKPDTVRLPIPSANGKVQGPSRIMTQPVEPGQKPTPLRVPLRPSKRDPVSKPSPTAEDRPQGPTRSITPVDGQKPLPPRDMPLRSPTEGPVAKPIPAQRILIQTPQEAAAPDPGNEALPTQDDEGTSGYLGEESPTLDQLTNMKTMETTTSTSMPTATATTTKIIEVPETSTATTTISSTAVTDDDINIYPPVLSPITLYPDGDSWMNQQPLYQMFSPPPTPSDGDATSLVQEDIYTTGQDFVRSLSVGQQRTLWKEVNRVIDGDISGKLNKHEKEYQEIKFEILTSEASYLRSLNLMKSHFANNELLMTTLSREDYTMLFFHIKPIRKCSKKFQMALDNCWNYSVYLLGLFDVINTHAQENFNVYIKYCSRMKEIQEKLKSALSTNKKFAETLSNLENNEACSFLSLDSFFTLPLQRITKLPLLLQAALDILTKHPDSFQAKCYENEREGCLRALDTVRKITQRCDRDTKTTERMQRMIRLKNKLVFPDDISQLALISPERWLDVTGDVKCLSWREYQKMNAKKSTAIAKKSNLSMRLYLLNDMLIFTKSMKGKEELYKVIDYCSRASITISFPNPSDAWNADLVKDFEGQFKILMTIAENHEHRRAEMVFSCTWKKDRNIWVKYLTKNVRDTDYLSTTTLEI